VNIFLKNKYFLLFIKEFAIIFNDGVFMVSNNESKEYNVNIYSLV
jgi:hypothetical protein